MHRAFVGSDGTVSIVKIVSLSPRIEKPKSQEGNKSVVPELPRVVSVSRDSYAYERFTYQSICIVVLWLCNIILIIKMPFSVNVSTI